MDLVLRLFLVTGCVFLIVLACRTAIWTVDPWYRAIFGGAVAVAIDPVDFAEGGKLDPVKGNPAARALSQRLQHINEQLRRDLSQQYAEIQRTLSVTLPDASTP